MSLSTEWLGAEGGGGWGGGRGHIVSGTDPLASASASVSVSESARRKTSCPLCNLNTLWNILMILGRNVE